MVPGGGIDRVVPQQSLKSLSIADLRVKSHTASHLEVEFGRVDRRIELQNRLNCVPTHVIDICSVRVDETPAVNHQLRAGAVDFDVRSVDAGIFKHSGNGPGKIPPTGGSRTPTLQYQDCRENVVVLLFEKAKTEGQIEQCAIERF